MEVSSQSTDTQHIQEPTTICGVPPTPVLPGIQTLPEKRPVSLVIASLCLTVVGMFGVVVFAFDLYSMLTDPIYAKAEGGLSFTICILSISSLLAFCGLSLLFKARWSRKASLVILPVIMLVPVVALGIKMHFTGFIENVVGWGVVLASGVIVFGIIFGPVYYVLTRSAVKAVLDDKV